MPLQFIPLDLLEKAAQSCGLMVFRTAALAPLREDEHRLAAWQEGGLAGEMSYMQGGPNPVCFAEYRVPPRTLSR